MKRILTLIAAIFAISAVVSAQDTIEKTFDFGEFEGIEAGFTHQVHVTVGESDKIKVTCPDKFAEYLDYGVTDGVLHLDVDLPNWKRNTLKSDNKITVHVQMKDISMISLSGTALLVPDGDFTADELEITMNGATRIEGTLRIKAESLNLNMSGVSEGTIEGAFDSAKGKVYGTSKLKLHADTDLLDIEVGGASKCSFEGDTRTIAAKCTGASNIGLSGSANDIDIECSGASKVNAEAMHAENVKAHASGASNIRVYGIKMMELRTSGPSAIKYFGPAEDIRISNESITRGE